MEWLILGPVVFLIIVGLASPVLLAIIDVILTVALWITIWGGGE